MDILASLILAHLVGDYLLQNDKMAALKVHPAHNPAYSKGEPYTEWQSFKWCFLHCALYTGSVVFFSAFSTMGIPHWSLLQFCFIAHLLIDHFRLAPKFMRLVGQEKFATGVCAPWSVFVVDNTFHLLTSWAIALLHLRFFA